MQASAPGKANLAIRNIEPALKERLRVRAAQNGRSMKAELRAILTEALGPTESREVDSAEAGRRRFEPFGGGVDDLALHAVFQSTISRLRAG